MKKLTAIALSSSAARHTALRGGQRRLALIAMAVLGMVTSFLIAVPGLSAAPARATTATTSVSMNSAGTRLATVIGSRAVVDFNKEADGFWYGPTAIGGTARADSPIVEDAAGDEVAFIGASSDIEMDTLVNGTWTGPATLGGSARAGSPLAISGDGSHVVFVDASGYVTNDWASGGTWAGPSRIGGTARSDSPIAINSNATHVYYVNTSGAVVNDWVSNGAWDGPAGIGGSARAGSSMATSTAGNIVAFIDANGYVVNDWINSSNGWSGPAEMGGTAEVGSPLALNGTPDHVYFLNTSGAVVNDYVSNGAWTGPSGIGGSAVSGSGMAAMTGSGSYEVAFFGSNGLDLDWYHAGWHGPGNPDTISDNLKGGNWANTTASDLPDGISTTDTPAQAESDAETIAAEFEQDTGGNTLRIPLYGGIVSSPTLWPVYAAAVQGILAANANVILCFGNQNGLVPGSNGVPDMNAYFAQWDTVTSQFGDNPHVFFELLNEPHGYSSASALVNDVYTPWLNRYPSIARARVLLDGTGYADDVTDVGALVSGTRLSVHDYGYWHTSWTAESQWESSLAGEIGGYAGRTVVTEWGGTMVGGPNYDAASSSYMVSSIRGLAAEERSLGVGSTLWIGIAAADDYRLFNVSGTSLTLTDQSGLDQLRHSWGD